MAFSSILYLWNKWNIRGFVILSLLLQVLLILFASLRKKIKNNSLIFLLWLAYLMADWVAAFGIGLISHNEGSSCAHVAEVDRALRVFWASFLLLHLGGPDTITAFSLEDNSLWGRHLLSLTFQVNAIIYVFVQIFPSDKSLMFPTMLVFLAGVIKNVERTLALNLSSLPRLKEWMLSQQEFHDDKDDKCLVELKGLLERHSHDEEEANLAEHIVVKHAYYFFQISKVFLTDLIFTQTQRVMSVRYFRKVSAVDALRVIAVELHFFYEVLHTKALTTRSKWSYVFRFIAFIDIAIAFVLFNCLKKHQLPELDVKITYLLLFGGIALDAIAMLMLVFSDWTIAEIQWHKIGSSTLDSFLHNLVTAADDLWKPRFATCKAEPNTEVTYKVLDTPLLFQRWSESVHACNLLSEILEKSPRKMYKRLEKSPRKMYKHDWRWANTAFSNICSFPFYVAEKTISCFHRAVYSITGGCGPRKLDGKRSVIANTRYVSTNPFIKELWIFIFKEVRRKSIYAINPDRDWSIVMWWDDNDVVYPPGPEMTVEIDRTKEIHEARGNWIIRNIQQVIAGSKTTHSVTNANYHESIIIWHLATEIWYNREVLTPKTNEREFSKILSDYMMYLLLNQPNLMSAVTSIAKIKLADILQILRNKFRAENVESSCNKIFPDDGQTIPIETEDLLLHWFINLAKELGELGERKWEVMSGVWVEILSYAAVHIKGEAHAQVLSRGGELLTFVWLLMIHFGLFHRLEWAPFNVCRICFHSDDNPH